MATKGIAADLDRFLSALEDADGEQAEEEVLRNMSQYVLSNWVDIADALYAFERRERPSIEVVVEVSGGVVTNVSCTNDDVDFTWILRDYDNEEFERNRRDPNHPANQGDDEDDTPDFYAGVNVIANRSMGDKMLYNQDTLDDPDCEMMPYEKLRVAEEEAGVVITGPNDGKEAWQQGLVEVEFERDTYWVNPAWIDLDDDEED
jgi:hypothetical protein